MLQLPVKILSFLRLFPADLFISTDEYQATENAGAVGLYGGPIVWQAQWRLAYDPGNHGHLPNLKEGKYSSGER